MIGGELVLIGGVLLFLPPTMQRLTKTVCPAVMFDTNAIGQHVQGYAEDHGGRYPATLQEAWAYWVEESGGDERLPWVDSWGNPYVYTVYPGDPVGRGYTLRKLGSDGALGGSGDARDWLHVGGERKGRSGWVESDAP